MFQFCSHPAPPPLSTKRRFLPFRDTKKTAIWKYQRKTRFCRNIQDRGFCKYSNSCFFAHTKEELMQKNKSWFPNYVCKNFYNLGSCSYGSRCKFYHLPRYEKKDTMTKDEVREYSPRKDIQTNSMVLDMLAQKIVLSLSDRKRLPICVEIAP